MSNTKNSFCLNNVTKAYILFSQAVRDEEQIPNAAEDILNKIMPALMEAQPPLIGEADDYHNFSVSVLKRFDDYGVALDIIELGLRGYSKNTDLLADAIKYSMNCAMNDKAEGYYSTLCGVNKSIWTWRSFSFSIDFLMSQYFDGDEHKKADALSLVEEYKSYFPDREDPWKCEEDIYSRTNNIKKAIEVLEKAIKEHVLCPKCWLRYADLMVDRGNYPAAEIYLKKLTTNPKAAESVNMAYVFYLDGLCRMTAWLQTDEYQSGEFDKKAVETIYRCFRKAVNHSDCREDLRGKILNLARSVYDETGFPTKIDGIDE